MHRMSEKIDLLAKALTAAQKEMKGAIKDSSNAFFKNNYADLGSCWEACREPLSKHGLSVSQLLGLEGDIDFLETILMHDSGQWISGRQRLFSKDQTAQSMGSAITYSRRYGLSAIIGLTQADDDGESAQGRPQQRPTQAPQRPAQSAPRPTNSFPGR